MSVRPVTMSLLDAIKARRTHYALSKKSTLSDDELKSLIQNIVMDVPSPFNIQSARAVLVTAESNNKLWNNIVLPGYLKLLGGDQTSIKTYTQKIEGYAAGYGTVLFFEDQSVIGEIAAKIPAMASHFPVWSENATGMLQYAVWTALAAEGMGASLQHYGAYSEELSANVLKEFDLPATWKSTSMMPFGVATGKANPSKTFKPIEERVMVRN